MVDALSVDRTVVTFLALKIALDKVFKLSDLVVGTFFLLEGRARI